MVKVLGFSLDLQPSVIFDSVVMFLNYNEEFSTDFYEICLKTFTVLPYRWP